MNDELVNHGQARIRACVMTGVTWSGWIPVITSGLANAANTIKRVASLETRPD